MDYILCLRSTSVRIIAYRTATDDQPGTLLSCRSQLVTLPHLPYIAVSIL